MPTILVSDLLIPHKKKSKR